MLKKYIEYLKNNPEGYWFKRKLFGWGWIPVTWQGYLVTCGFMAIVIFLAMSIDSESPTREVLFMGVLPILILTTVFLRIAYKKGEKPKWQWGIPKKQDSEQDKQKK